MDANEQTQPECYYFVTWSGMSGTTVFDPDEAAKYRAMKGWREVSEQEFDRVLTSAIYSNAGQYNDYD